jgi:hypothetical protein
MEVSYNCVLTDSVDLNRCCVLVGETMRSRKLDTECLIVLSQLARAYVENISLTGHYMYSPMVYWYCGWVFIQSQKTKLHSQQTIRAYFFHLP